MKRTALNTALALLMAASLTGCVSPSRQSTDADVNYQEVFSGVNAPKPVIVNSHVEELHRSVVGVVPISGERTGDWQFELIASPAWIAETKPRFTAIPFPQDFPDKWQLPPWFTPTPDKFTAWAITGTSYPLVRMFIEKDPQSPQQIHIFIRR